jgi:ribosomal-protein-serine acetyltransferase
MKPFLRVDDRTELHLARPELAEAVYAAIDANRLHLRQWLPWVDATRSVEDTLQFIRESMRHNTDGSRLSLFITHDGELAGAIGVVSFQRDHAKCEVGYWLRADLQGRGIMTRAYAALLAFLFQKKAIRRAESHVFVGNERSAAVLQRLGFRHEGTLREAMQLYGDFRDLQVFGLLKSDWERENGHEKIIKKFKQKILR